MHLSVPWTQLLVDPCQLRLHNVHLVICPAKRHRHDTNSDDLHSRLSESVMMAVEDIKKRDAAASATAPTTSTTSTSAAPPSIAEDSIKYVASYLEKIFMATEVVVRNLSLTVLVDVIDDDDYDVASSRAALVIRVASIETWRDSDAASDTKANEEQSSTTSAPTEDKDSTHMRYIAGRKLAFDGLHVELERHYGDVPKRRRAASVSSCAQDGDASGDYKEEEEEEEEEVEEEDELDDGSSQAQSSENEDDEFEDARCSTSGRRDSSRTYQRWQVLTSARRERVRGGAGREQRDSGFGGSVLCSYESNSLDVSCSLDAMCLLVSPERTRQLSIFLEGVLEVGGADEGEDEAVYDEHVEGSVNHSMYRSTMLQQSVYESTMDTSMKSTLLHSRAGETFFDTQTRLLGTSSFSADPELEKAIRGGSSPLGIRAASLEACDGENDDTHVTGCDILVRVGLTRVVLVMCLDEDANDDENDSRHMHSLLAFEVGTSELTIGMRASECRNEIAFTTGGLSLYVLDRDEDDACDDISSTNTNRSVRSHDDEYNLFRRLQEPMWSTRERCDEEGTTQTETSRRQSVRAPVLHFVKPEGAPDDASMHFRSVTETTGGDASQSVSIDVSLWAVEVVLSPTSILCIDAIVRSMKEPITFVTAILMSLRSESDVPPRARTEAHVDFVGARIVALGAATSETSVDNDTNHDGVRECDALVMDIMVQKRGSYDPNACEVETDDEGGSEDAARASICFSSSQRYGEPEKCSIQANVADIVAYAMPASAMETGVEILRVRASPRDYSERSHNCDGTPTDDAREACAIGVTWTAQPRSKTRPSRADAMTVVRSHGDTADNSMTVLQSSIMESSKCTVELCVELVRLSISEHIATVVQSVMHTISTRLRSAAVENAAAAGGTRPQVEDSSHIMTSSSFSVALALDSLHIVLVNGKSAEISTEDVQESADATMRLSDVRVFHADLGRRRERCTYTSVIVDRLTCVESGARGPEILFCSQSSDITSDTSTASGRGSNRNIAGNVVASDSSSSSSSSSCSSSSPVLLFGYVSSTASTLEPAVLTCECHGVAFMSRRHLVPSWILELPARIARWAPPIETRQSDIDVAVVIDSIAWLHSTSTASHVPVHENANGRRALSMALTTLQTLRLSHSCRSGEEHIDIRIGNLSARVHSDSTAKCERMLPELLRATCAATKVECGRDVIVLGDVVFHVVAFEKSVNVVFDGRLGQKQGRGEMSNYQLNIIVSPSVLRAISHIMNECRVEDVTSAPSDGTHSTLSKSLRSDTKHSGMTSRPPEIHNVLGELTSDAFVANETCLRATKLFEDEDDFQLVYVFSDTSGVAKDSKGDGLVGGSDADHRAGHVLADERRGGDRLSAHHTENSGGRGDGAPDGHLYGDERICIVDNHLSVAGDGSVSDRGTHAIGPLPDAYPASTMQLALRGMDIVVRLKHDDDDINDENGETATHEDLEARFEDVNVQFDIFPDTSSFAWRCGVAVRDFILLDHSPHASWRDVLCYYHRPEEPRETHSSMAEVVIDAVRSAPLASEPVELRIVFNALPLRLRLDQRLIHFIAWDLLETMVIPPTSSSSSKASDHGGASAAEVESQPSESTAFIQSCTISSWLLFVDYIPRRMNMSSLRSGNLAELLNIVSWGGVKLELSGQSMTGIAGVNTLCLHALKVWLDDIVSTQVHKFARGMVAVRSVCSIAEGVGSLISMPIKEMRKGEHGQISRGIKKGFATLAKSIGNELAIFKCTPSSSLSKAEYTAWRESVVSSGEAIVVNLGSAVTPASMVHTSPSSPASPKNGATPAHSRGLNAAAESNTRHTSSALLQ